MNARGISVGDSTVWSLRKRAAVMRRRFATAQKLVRRIGGSVRGGSTRRLRWQGSLEDLSKPAPGQMQPQMAGVTEPSQLYRDVAIFLDANKMLTNGNRTTRAPWLDALRLAAGKSVFHLGCGTGYYTAIMAEVVGPRGKVTAVEVDPALAARR